MIDIDQIDPADRLPRPPNPNRVEDVLVEFIDLTLEDEEGRHLPIGPVPCPAGLNRARAAVWAAEVYYPQVVAPKARHLLNLIGDGEPDAEAIARIRTFMQHGGKL